MHTADADVGAMQLRIAFTYNDLEGCWTARVAQVLDNDGNEEWDIAAFNALVLSAFACYNAQATQQQLCKQLQATVAHNNSALYFAVH